MRSLLAAALLCSLAATAATAQTVTRTTGGLSQQQLNSMDIETALMAVQQQRSTLLDEQLKRQIADVQGRNKEIAKLNEELNAVQCAASDAACIARRDAIKQKIGSLSNSQQMDMLRLQSMTNKRNEAFDTMTNLVAKMKAQRDSIVGNMR